jgi:hypothetical protein
MELNGAMMLAVPAFFFHIIISLTLAYFAHASLHKSFAAWFLFCFFVPVIPLFILLGMAFFGKTK